MSQTRWTFTVVLAEKPKDESTKQFIIGLNKMARAKIGNNLLGIEHQGGDSANRGGSQGADREADADSEGLLKIKEDEVREGSPQDNLQAVEGIAGDGLQPPTPPEIIL